MPSSEYRSAFRSGLFEGRVVLVTGGGSGIGRCTAHELAALGASIALAGRTLGKLEAVAAELRSRGTRVTHHPLDIRDEASVQRVVGDVLREHGRLDGVVNNAGGQFPAAAENISLNGWDAVVRTNLGGGFLVAREAYRQFLHEHGGAIVNLIADMWGGMPGMSHSGAARAGMLNLTESLAVEWARSGVRVNAVAPGWIASSGLDRYPPETVAQLRRLRRIVPLQRLGTEAEVSAAIVFLLSPAAAFITGSCIRVDGGVPNARHTWPAQPMEHDSEATRPFDAFPLASRPRVLDEP
ncbi:MAG: 2,4-dienoyl-CoA reductase [Burkholderiales bacterium]|jgi:citronellol/citronellal dehydrogenase|nr:MAG: 2,4-dienoyl-CoA reductase [Burkholderiales bacterium]